jgi:hypothetical protein
MAKQADTLHSAGYWIHVHLRGALQKKARSDMSGTGL